MIRTLTLSPATCVDLDINIKLTPGSLTSCTYEALSYTWGTEDGDASLSQSIYCDGAIIKVSKNCEKALRRLRLRTEERVLWIDAICIDQTNHGERGRQVALMDLIYLRARRVVIWLGDASKDLDSQSGCSVSDVFLSYLPSMVNVIRESQALGDYSSPINLYNRLTREAAEYVASGNLTTLVQGFLYIVLRPWWERVWVVQEAALNMSATVLCGKHEVDYQDFYDFFSHLYGDISHDGGLTFSLLEGFKHQMYAVYLVRERVTDLGPATVLHDVLARSRRLRATDKRDHVFALLNIMGDLKSQLTTPDYKNTLVEVFTDMSTKFLNLLTPFEILLQATNTIHTPDFPSWVTDWSQRPQLHIPPSDGLYSASRGSSASYSVSNHTRELRARGAFIDVLQSIPKAAESSYQYPYVPSKGILGYQKSCEVGFSLTTYPTGEAIRDVLWRTLCWNVDSHCHYPADAGLAKSFDKFHEALFSGNSMMNIEKDLLEKSAAFNDICVHSMPIGITSQGFLASVPWTSEAGDLIVILAGGEVPFIIRRNSTGQNYRLIGSSYVHGMMNGELFPSEHKTLDWITLC
ncbi:heterokaryon incompatibility [Fusarium longipes]|uniref:Heterokaryon incompatibility n=1 Tax=Fusarium longipes TaxID=694270 RepID=A0A395T5T8_9HYPO|nr:heterokaryon incompatibility [Fusarium longipes]